MYAERRILKIYYIIYIIALCFLSSFVLTENIKKDKDGVFVRKVKGNPLPWQRILNKQTVSASSTSMDELIGIHLKRIYLHEPDFFLCEPVIDAYLVDKTSGSCTKGFSSDLNSHASPFALGDRRSSSDCSKLLVIDGDFSSLNTDSKLLVFDVCKKVRRKKAQGLENKRIAWAFLAPLAADGSSNTNQDLKLQLYKVGKDCKVSHQNCNVYHLYSEHKRKKLHAYLQLSVNGVVPIKSKPSPTKQVQDDPPPAEKPNQSPPIVKTSPKIWKWSRLPSQTCKIPNKIHATHNLGKDGVSCFQFSRKGIYVASAALSRIVIHDVVSGAEINTFNGHFGFIYDLDWSFDDQQILSVSNDCRGIIWSLDQKTPLFVLPHPSYVYCGRWLENNDQVVTGGRDHILRFWVKNEESFDLIEEMPGHSGFISAMATQEECLITGDSWGVIAIRRHTDGGFTLLKELTFSEISKNVIDSIHFHKSRRRIGVTVRSRGSFLIDVVSGIILQAYPSGVNALARLISCLTPCGSMLFTYCQDGDVSVWEVNTGRLLATYGRLFPIDSFTDLSGCIQYHPYEHMLGLAALGRNCSLHLLKYDLSKKDDSEKLGLVFTEKKFDYCSPRITSNRNTK